MLVVLIEDGGEKGEGERGWVTVIKMGIRGA